MHAGNEVPVEVEISENIPTNKRQIQVTGSGPVSVKRGRVAVSNARNRTSTENCRLRLRHFIFDDRAEFFEFARIALEGKPDDVLSHFRSSELRSRVILRLPRFCPIVDHVFSVEWMRAR